MTATAHTVRTMLAERRRAAAAAHHRGASGLATSAALAAAMDEAVLAAWGGVGGDGETRIAVAAVGGYARRELSPYSDADVMVLCRSGAGREAAESDAKRFLHVLGDAGVDMGHSVRALEDLDDPALRRVDTWASLVEVRHLCGDVRLTEALLGRVAGLGDGALWFVEGVLEDLAKRHDRYGHSAKLLEPNVKKSAGGLRDLQSAFWLHRASEPPSPGEDDGRPPLGGYLEHLAASGVLASDEAAQGVAALEFLLRTRHEMSHNHFGEHGRGCAHAARY